MVLIFSFLAANVQPVCTRKPQLGQFLSRILGALCTKGASAAQDGLGVCLLSPALFFVAGSWRFVLPHKSQKKFIWNY